MSNDIPKLVIRSEDEAWQILDEAVHGREFPDGLNLRFEGWPSFELVVRGDDWHGTVPTRIMPALLQVQRDLHRAYANIRYSEPNLRRLKDEERDSIEVVVKVDKGSSAYDADLWQQLTQLAQAAVGRMNGTEAVITVLGVALTIMTPTMFKLWLNARVKEKRMDHDLVMAENESNNRLALSQEETKRLEVMREAAKREPIVDMAREDADATTNRLLKATRPGDSMSIGDVKVSSAEAHELVRPERERAREVEMHGVFEMLGNRTDMSDGFRIRIRKQGDDEVFHADVPLGLPHDQQEAIQKAEWSKGKVMLWIDAERLHDIIQNAVVTKAKSIDGDNDAR